MSVKSIPEGYHSVTPYLIVRGAAEAIEFYQKAFGATELLPLSHARWKDRPCRNQDRRFADHVGR